MTSAPHNLVTSAPHNLLTAVHRGLDRPAVTMPDGTLTYHQLKVASSRLSERMRSDRPIGLWATAELSTVVGLVAALAVSTPVVPLNPKSGPRELGHVVRDAKLDAIVAGGRALLPEATGSLRQIRVDVPRELEDGGVPAELHRPSSGHPTLIMYTSGTTGPPKGVVLSDTGIGANLDALAKIWGWTDDDVVVHALPLFHVHGLILGVLGPLYVGGHLHHLGPFSTGAVAQALAEGGTMLFAVPTMYHRLADALEVDPHLAPALRHARLLVSGSGPLASRDQERLERASGRRVIERYGMTETLIITSGDPQDPPAPGSVGRALDGVEVRVVDDEGDDVRHDDQSVGTVLVRSPSVYLNYLNQPNTAPPSSTWFRTGDLGVLSVDGTLRLVGRASTDLIKSGGFRIATAEIELVLREHPSVDDAAVRGVPDADLGERIVAWVVLVDGVSLDAQELIDYVAERLTAHKRPRDVRFIDAVPRNDMGKVQKHLLT